MTRVISSAVAISAASGRRRRSWGGRQRGGGVRDHGCGVRPRRPRLRLGFVVRRRRSEETIGRWLASGGRRRRADEQVFFPSSRATTAGSRRSASAASPRDSLERLGVDRIDLYLTHEPDPETPLVDDAAALDELVATGRGPRVRRLERRRRARRGGRRAGGGSRWVQNEYSLLVREAEDDVLPLCARAWPRLHAVQPARRRLAHGEVPRGDAYPEGSRMTMRPDSVRGDDVRGRRRSPRSRSAGVGRCRRRSLSPGSSGSRTSARSRGRAGSAHLDTVVGGARAVGRARRTDRALHVEPLNVIRLRAARARAADDMPGSTSAAARATRRRCARTAPRSSAGSSGRACSSTSRRSTRRRRFSARRSRCRSSSRPSRCRSSCTPKARRRRRAPLRPPGRSCSCRPRRRCGPRPSRRRRRARRVVPGLRLPRPRRHTGADRRGAGERLLGARAHGRRADPRPP